MQALNELLDSITIGSPQVFEEVEVFPLFSSRSESSPLLELDEALAKGLVEVTEVSDGGTVPQLNVINTSPRDVIIYDGQQLIGAKQNRTVNITVVVPANSTLPIPVSCVEQQRWRYTSPNFASSDRFAYPSLRRSTHSEVTRSKETLGTSNADQHRVWQDISYKAARMDVFSDTGAMEDIYESQAPKLAVLDQAFKIEEKQIGYMAFIKGGFAGCDMFGSTEVCRGKMEKLLRGYYLDSVDKEIVFDKVEIDEIFREVRAAEHREFETVGKGRERRFDAAHVQGSWKEVDGSIPHVTILPRG
ncbi:MAG: ARPP-1 family domain-containing protein [Pyrinomonadaceae bacterium]